MSTGPLHGIRVIDLTDDSGRFATKLLAESGASVVRIGHGTPGPAMRDAAEAAKGGLLDWWYDGGKRRADIDLDTEAGREAYRLLAEVADLIIDTEPPGRLESLGLAHAELVKTNPRLVQVSLTPFGLTGPRKDWQSSDLVAAAMGGVGDSGLGHRHGPGGLLTYTEPQTIATQRLLGFGPQLGLDAERWGQILARAVGTMGRLRI